MRDFLWINWVNLLVLGCASGQVLLPEHLRRSGLTQWEIGMIWASFALAAILVRFQLGRWMARWGQLPFYYWGALIVAVCQTCYAVLPPQALLIWILRSFEGLALASYFTAIWSRVIDSSLPGKVGRTTGLFGISGLCAGALGPWALERIANSQSYPTAFGWAAGAGWLGFACSLYFRTEVKPPDLAASVPFWTIAGHTAMRSTLISSWLFGMALGVYNTFIVVYAVQHHLVPVGPLFLIYTGVSIGMRFRMGHLADRWHPKWIIVPSLVLLGLAFAGLSGLHWKASYALLLGCGAAIGSAHGMIYPAISNLALRRAGSDSNGASAVFTAAMDLGNLVGCAAAGWTAHFMHHAAAFAGLAVLLWGGAVGVVRLESRAELNQD